MTLSRDHLTNEIKSMPKGSRGRRVLEAMVKKLTVAELSEATGIKPRFRVKAGRSLAGKGA